MRLPNEMRQNINHFNHSYLCREMNRLHSCLICVVDMSTVESNSVQGEKQNKSQSSVLEYKYNKNKRPNHLMYFRC